MKYINKNNNKVYVSTSERLPRNTTCPNNSIMRIRKRSNHKYISERELILLYILQKMPMKFLQSQTKQSYL